MQGGLLKSASAVALFAAAGLYGASPAKAADLGGDCCADLEERVAELEATTVRKGTRKVSITLSGFVSHNVMWWDDGTQSDTYFGDGGNYGSRFRFVGTAKISPQLTAGFLYEFGANANAIGSMNQSNGGDDLGNSGPTGANSCQQTGSSLNSSGCPVVRDATVWLRHSQLGMIKTGHGSTATDNLTLIDTGGLAGASTSDVALYMGGFALRGNNSVLGGNTWTNAIRGHESWDTSRRNHVLYETPSLVGFTLQAAVAEDNFWDVALRYAGEFGGFRIAAGIGYMEDTKFNAPAGLTAGNTSILCGSFCDTKVTDIKGSASILHVPTGLFLTGAAGNREIESASPNPYAGPDLRFWYLAGGISQNFFGIGKTVLFGEYSDNRGGLAQTNFLAGTTTHCFAASGCDSKVTHWGVGVVQYIDAAAMEIFATYKNYSLDANGFSGTSATLNSGASGVSDIQAVIVGTRINF